MLKALFSIVLLASASISAHARTIYVGGGTCVAMPTPCTTDLQGALDDVAYSEVTLLPQVVKTGDFVITRSLTLTGIMGAQIDASTTNGYALRVESTSQVTIQTLIVDGRVAVYDSNDVTLKTVDITGGDLGFQVVASQYVTLDDCSTNVTSRGVDATDSRDITVVDGDYEADSYGFVGSSSEFTLTSSSVHGDSHALVMQDGSAAYTPDLSATTATLTTTGGNATTWRWTQATTSYSQTTATETVSSSGSLVSLVGYTPWGGE